MKTYKKGLQLQEEFANFLKNELNWEKVSIEAPVSGGINKQGTKVDIIAERLSEKGKSLKKLAIIYLIICGIALFYGFIIGFASDWENEWGEALIYIGLILEIAGFIAAIFSLRFNIENAWVECKNLKTKANKDQVRKMLDEYNDYKKSNDKKYKVKELYFVSANGFIKNALEYAEHYGVKCYIKTGKNKFEKIGFWE